MGKNVQHTSLSSKWNDGWKIETWRILLVLFLAAVGGMVTGFWSASLIVSLVAYITWFLFKLNQLHQWLMTDAKPHLVPDSNGIWGRNNQQILSIKKKSNKRKERMSSVMKRLKGIITGLPYATVVLNENNEIDWANKLSKEYLGIDVKKDRGQRIDNLIRLPEVNKILEGNSKSEIEVNFTSGAYDLVRQVSMQILPLEGDLKLLIARDISDRININKMRKSFITNASHELRTPLTVIAGYIEIMREDDAFPEHLRPAIISATDQSVRMQRIIEDLLTLSRLENSELNEDNSNIIDIPGVLESVYKDESSLIIDDSHTISKAIDKGVKLKGSEAELVSLCSNLVHNAVRHTQNGTQVSVDWGLNDKGEACLTVKDNGQGIPAEHLIHLTERFYRVDKGRSRNKGGTGLGLAIVQHIIQRHGGSLDIQSEVSVGTSFIVTFPESRTVIV